MRLSAESLKKWILVGLCVAAVALVALPARYARGLRHAVRPVLVPSSEAGTRVAVHLRTRLDEMAASPDSLEQEKVTALRQQILLMRQMIKRQREQIRSLTKWTGTLDGFTCKLLPARVVGSEPLPMSDRRLIDVGRGSGVRAGDIVTTARLVHESPVALPDKLIVLGQNYVVGWIVDCSAYAATIQLVTDPQFQVPAKLWRVIEPGQERDIYETTPDGSVRKRTLRHDGRQAGLQLAEPIPVIAQGDGQQVVLRHVPASHGIRPGDILTSDDSTELLPLGLSIGRVSSLRREERDAHFVTVFVKPLAELRGLRDVYVVLPYRKAGR